MPGIVAPAGYPEELTKYVKMLKMGVPEPAVRGKMAQDGIDDDMFDKYLNPETAITLNQEPAEEESGDAEEKKDELEVDLLDPNQPDSNAAPPPSQSQQPAAPQPASQPTGFFSSQNFVPPADSELKMDTLQSVPVKKTLLIVNTFVVNTAAFLNKFVTTCESKLHKIHTDIQRMETTMLLLESKLSSIDWLRQAEQGQAPLIPKIDESWETAEFKDNALPNSDPNEADHEQKGDGGGGGGEVAAPPPEPEKPAEDPLLSDPDMTQWFKMLKVGVPEPAVRGKMSRCDVPDDVQDRIIELHNSR
mmetsp:Transcript_25468/g.40525  ORF Transcript_25468/g.40525 Transcript_25468/m.40525 type:complete len:304 (-) Transcript_25468:255-1166(-)